MRSKLNGFTIIELLVVIAVIGILTTISVVSFTRYQADARDSQRAQRASVISSALEKYYSTHGEYPSCSAMTTSAATVTTTLPGIDPTVIVTPQATAGHTDSIDLCVNLSTSSPTDSFAYVGDGSAACSGNQSCLQYTLEYKQESTSTIQKILSRHNTNINTSGTIAGLTGSANQFSSASLNWGSINNASNYTLQTANDAGFTSLVSTTYPTTNASTIGGLTPGAPYYFRVAANAPGSQSNWSNTLNLTMLHIATPGSPSAVDDGTNPISQLDFSWTSVSGVSSYSIDYSTSSTFASSVSTINGLTGTSYSVSSLAPGTTLYFRVKAVAPDDVSSYTATMNATTIVPAPTGVAMTVTSSNTFYASWNASSGATSYNVQYSTDGGSTWTTAGSTSTLQYNFGPGAQEGQLYYVRVQAAAGTATSNWSSSASGTTPIDAPASYTISSSTSGYYLNATSNAICPSGTSGNYIWYANGSLWVQGPSYQSVGYYTDYGQSNTLTVTTQCYRGSVYGNGTNASNSATWSRAAPPTPPGVSMTGITRGQVQNCGSGYWVLSCSGNYYSASVQLNYPGGCTDTTTYYNINVSYNSGGPNGTNYNRTEWVRWYYIQPTSGYTIKFFVQNWCQAADGVQSGAASNQACIQDPNNTTGCF